MSALRLLRPILMPIIYGGLAARFDRRATRAILDETLADYETQRSRLPHEASQGGRFMVRLAALTISLYRSLLRRGVPADDARSLTASVTWQAYEKMAVVPTSLAAIGTHHGRNRVKRATDLFRRFPFGPSSYQMTDVVADDDVVAFDVHRCPVAEYFKAQGLGSLCVASWCDLDFPLAERWGARLERRGTIAGGARRCDFRWRVAEPERSPASEAEPCPDTNSGVSTPRAIR